LIENKKPEQAGTAQQPKLEEAQEFHETIISINRVAKVVKGGKRFSFSALAVVGDGNGGVGYGLGKANEVSECVKKALAVAKKTMVKVSLKEATVPHEIIGHFGAAKVVLKPASPGTGVIAGHAVRAVCEAAGIKNILTKALGSTNPINVVKATVDGLTRMRLTRKRV